MGNAVSDMIKTVDKADEKEKIAKEQLELLMKLADARLDTFEEKLNRMFIDKECKCSFQIFCVAETECDDFLQLPQR